MDSFLHLNQLLQQDAFARQAAGEPQGLAAQAARSSVVEDDNAGRFWGGEGYPFEGKPIGVMGWEGGDMEGSNKCEVRSFRLGKFATIVANNLPRPNSSLSR